MNAETGLSPVRHRRPGTDHSSGGQQAFRGLLRLPGGGQAPRHAPEPRIRSIWSAHSPVVRSSCSWPPDTFGDGQGTSPFLQKQPTRPASVTARKRTV
jgi:hypothetical protein